MNARRNVIAAGLVALVLVAVSVVGVPSAGATSCAGGGTAKTTETMGIFNTTAAETKTVMYWVYNCSTGALSSPDSRGESYWNTAMDCSHLVGSYSLWYPYNSSSSLKVENKDLYGGSCTTPGYLYALNNYVLTYSSSFGGYSRNCWISDQAYSLPSGSQMSCGPW